MGLADGSGQEGNVKWDVWPRFHVSSASYLAYTSSPRAVSYLLIAFVFQHLRYNSLPSSTYSHNRLHRGRHPYLDEYGPVFIRTDPRCHHRLPTCLETCLQQSSRLDESIQQLEK